jgi:hypothetical protein
MKTRSWLVIVIVVSVLEVLCSGCTRKEARDARNTAESPNTYFGKPYRTFVTIQRYNMEQNGEGGDSVSNVAVKITFPSGETTILPEDSQYWPIGNGQIQEINRTYEIPWRFLHNDGFKMTLQMIRQGTRFLPCELEVAQLSQFNRSYVCRTALQWQLNQHIPEKALDREGIQIRVFSDLNSSASEIPSDLARK